MERRFWMLGAALALAGPAGAAIVNLDGVTPSGPNSFTFTYHATLGPDEGLRAGDRLIIYDFASYIGGSISTGANADFSASVENLSPSGIITPGFTDNPLLANLVFVYNGPNFHNQNGPFPSFTFEGFSARSTFGGITETAFFARTTKNNPNNRPGGSNTPVLTLGVVGTPLALVPEPTSWAMMLGGFGLMGIAARRRNRSFATMARPTRLGAG